ncbi:MAG: DNA polymerase III subunit delta [bacterium]
MELVRDEKEQIFKGKKAPFYLLHGQTEFLQNEFAERIANFLLGDEDRDSTLVKCDCEGINDVEPVLESLAQPSLFSPLRVVVVKNAQNMKVESRETPPSKTKIKGKKTEHPLQEQFKRLARSPLPGIHAIFIADSELKEKTSSTSLLECAYAEINRNGYIVRFPRIYEKETVNWIISRARTQNLRLSREQAELLLVRSGKDLRHLANEINKLALFAEQKKSLDDTDIFQLAINSEADQHYDLVDTLFAGKKSEVASLLEQLRKSNIHPLQIIASIASQLRLTWQARYLLKKGYFKDLPDSFRGGTYDYVLSQIRQISKSELEQLSEEPRQAITAKIPFVIHKYFTNARRLSPRILERWLLYCERTDRSLKGISRDATSDDIVLDKLIAAMMREIKN